jgi:DNA polymerase-3 subunit alpha
MRPEGVSVRIQSVESLEKAASREQRDLTIFLRDQSPVRNLSPLLSKRGNSRVSFVIIQGNGSREVEVQLKERYSVSSQLQSAMKAVPGVLDVELV